MAPPALPSPTALSCWIKMGHIRPMDVERWTFKFKFQTGLLRIVSHMRTSLSFTYRGYIKYPTYPVQCSKTAVFSGLEWNFWFEKIYFFEKTCEMTAVTLVTICTYVAKHIEFADLLRYLQCFSDFTMEFWRAFFALELLHAKN